MNSVYMFLCSISNEIYLSLWIYICKLVLVEAKHTINHVILCKGMRVYE